MHADSMTDGYLGGSMSQPLISTRELAVVWPFINEQTDKRLFARARWVWLPGLVGELCYWLGSCWPSVDGNGGVVFSCWLLSVTVWEELGDQLWVWLKRGWISIQRCVGVQWGKHQGFFRAVTILQLPHTSCISLCTIAMEC